MTIAQLGLAVDSSTVAAATPALDRMTAASHKAEAAAGGLGRASSNTSGMMQQLGAAVEAIQRDLTVLTNRALEAGNSVQAMGQRVAASAANTRMMGGSFSGLAAQFQDIGVTAAMGMNPMIIALQQGTQIAGQMEAAMAHGGKATSVFAQAFLSLLSPLSLVVIGLTAVAAAGLQMVDWAAVAKGALNGIAAALEVVAPYAVAASVGLALLYAPSMIAGAATLITSLGDVAKGIWGIATAIYATVGLPVLLIAGFTAVIAAAIIWRDDLAKILGLDIVQIAQDGLNAVIGFFVGGYNAIIGVWGLLPDVFADIFTMAMSGAIDIVQNGINGIIGALRLVPGLEGLKDADLSGYKSKPTGAAADAGRIISDAFANAQGQDYVGGIIGKVQKFASGAAEKLRELANGIKLVSDEDKKAAREAKRQAEAYEDITRGAHQRIAAAELEMHTLGMTTEQINAQRYAQELLNKAANDNIDLSGVQRDELTALGAAMAVAEEATRRLESIYDLGRETFRGFFGDLKAGIEEGEGLWESLGDAAANALQRIADKALQMATDGIWDMLFGAVMGAMTSGMGPTGGNWGNGLWGTAIFNARGNALQSSGLHQYANSVVDRPTVFPFAKGIGLMGEVGPEAIMPLKRTASGALGVQVANSNVPAAGNSNGGITVNAPITINGNADTMTLRQMDIWARTTLPGLVRKAVNDPHAVG